MAEYINRKQIQYTWWQKPDGTFTDGVTLESIINAMPTANVVEVVRCKDCKKREKQCFDKILNDDDFCSYGERRSDNG